MKDIIRARNCIIEAIDAINVAFQDEIEVPKEQLIRFQKSLNNMLQEIDSGDLPPKRYRINYMGHTIIDSWPLKTKEISLSEKIISAENTYLSI